MAVVKRVGPATLELIRRNGSADIDIEVVFGPGNAWRGTASFPAEMTAEAEARIAEVETPNDLEDLVRAWSNERTWASYQDFRNLNGF